MTFGVLLTLTLLIASVKGQYETSQWLRSREYAYPKCGLSKTRKDSTGQFEFHNQYLPEDTCLFIDPPEKGHLLTVSFLQFNFGFQDENGNCTNFVEIGSGQMRDTHRRYCGTLVPPPYISQTGDAWIWIHTENDYVYSIFDSDISIHYSTVSDCGGDVIVPLYTFVTSPGYPLSAPDNSKCEWALSLHYSAGNVPMQVQLNLWEVNFDTNFEVYDGIDTNSRLLARFDESTASQIATSKVIMTTGPNACIVFRRGKYLPDTTAKFNVTVKAKGYCLPGTYSCSDGESCYDSDQICDGHQDCYTGYDEQGCGGCPPKEFWCGNHDHNCYTLSEKCNGMKNCQTNMEDEINCKSCGPGSFLCAVDSRCIFERWRCDGDFDCSDRSDEEGCPYSASRRVITAAIIGSLICCLLLVIALGCTCKLYSLRASHHRHPHHHYRATPLTRVEREIFQRQAPPTYDMTIEGVGADLPAQPTRVQRQRRHRNRRYQFQRAMPASSGDQATATQRNEGMEVRSLPALPPQAASTPQGPTSPARSAVATPLVQQNDNKDLRQSVASFVLESVPDILAEMIFASRQNPPEMPGPSTTTPASTSTRSSMPLPIETRDSGTQTNANARREGASTPLVVPAAPTATRSTSSSGRRMGRSSSGSRSRSRRSGCGSNANTNGKEQQAKPLPKKKKIMPVMVPAPCPDGIVEDTLTCVYPSPPSYSEAVAAGSPAGPSVESAADPAAEADSSSGSLGSSFEEQGVGSPGMVDSVFASSPKSATRSKFSLPFSIGQAIRTITTSPFSKFQRNPYVQMENPGPSPTAINNEDEVQVEDQQPQFQPRQDRPSITSSDDDLIDCGTAADAVTSGECAAESSTPGEQQGSTALVKVFPQKQQSKIDRTSTSGTTPGPFLHGDTDSVELTDFPFGDGV